MISKGGIDLGVCVYCHCPLDDYSRTTDHLVPKSRGGILSNVNKRPSCYRCNGLKGDMTIEEFDRAISSMMRFEHVRHKDSISYLKKVKFNINGVMESLYGKK